MKFISINIAIIQIKQPLQYIAREDYPGFFIMKMATAESEEIIAYEQQVKKGIPDPHPYDRLMIHYRKEKQYNEELKIVERAIEVFGKQLEKQQDQMFKGTKNRSSIKRLSDQIRKSSGLSDKKGAPVYIPQPIANWLKRKETIEQKITKQHTNKKS